MSLMTRRKLGTGLVVGETTIIVTGIKGKSVQLRIIGPRDVNVYRIDEFGNKENRTREERRVDEAGD